jgi:serine/threonine protein phosphatase PrpC
MEDQHTCVVDFGGLTEHAFFCVYDGHGGAQAAIVAAELMVSTIQEDAQFKVYAASVAADGKGGDMAALAIALETAYIALDAKLRARPDVGDSGSTVCGFVLTPEHIVCANAGDSRGCLCRRGADGGIVAVPLSHDHKPSDPEEEARIIKAGGFVSQGAMRMGPMRVDGNLAVSRGLGLCSSDYQSQRAACAAAEQRYSRHHPLNPAPPSHDACASACHRFSATAPAYGACTSLES